MGWVGRRGRRADGPGRGVEVLEPELGRARDRVQRLGRGDLQEKVAEAGSAKAEARGAERGATQSTLGLVALGLLRASLLGRRLRHHNRRLWSSPRRPHPEATRAGGTIDLVPIYSYPAGRCKRAGAALRSFGVFLGDINDMRD